MRQGARRATFANDFKGQSQGFQVLDVTDKVHPARPSTPGATIATGADPLLLVPYMWIGDFVRCHTVVRLLTARFPNRPLDVLTTSLTAPLLDYMPGVRKGVVSDMPRRRLGVREQIRLAGQLRAEKYGTALIMSRKWKAALAPFLAGIPERIGFAGEARLLLLNDLRWGERKLPRMIDQCAALALPSGSAPPDELPPPQLLVPPREIAEWRMRHPATADGMRAVALAPGAVGPSKRWPAAYFGELAQRLTAEGFRVWVLGSPQERPLAAEIAKFGGDRVSDLTGHDLRHAVLALAAADAALSNDSGLLHVAAALGTPSIGIFGPTSRELWAPLNPLAGAIEMKGELACRPCHQPVCRFGHHRCMQEISVSQVLDAVMPSVKAAANRQF